MEFISRYRRYILTLAGGLLVAALMTGSSFGQGKPGNLRPTGPIPCPNPVRLTLAAPATAPGMNVNTPNHTFNYMFAWKMRYKCCQYLSASVTVKYTALQTGSPKSSTSGNDLISVAGMPSQYLYPSGAIAGHTYTMTIPVNATTLASLTNTLKVTAEDDTEITSLTLNLTACCLKNGIST